MEKERMDVTFVSDVGTGVKRVQETSFSSSNSSGRRTQMRLQLEMCIKQLPTENGNEGKKIKDDRGTPSTASNPPTPVEPVTVVVHYPEDMIVTVDARVRRLSESETRPSSLSPIEYESPRVKFTSVHDEHQNGTQMETINSTFNVKPPLSSTMINAPNDNEEDKENGAIEKDKSLKEWNVIKRHSHKSGSGSEEGNSFYQTVLDNPAGFGNLSAIDNAVDNGNENEKQTDTEDGSLTNHMNSLELEFKKRPSWSLNSKLFRSEKRSPAEKLLRALHIIARYRGAWGVYEDETRIVKHLENLNKLLTSADSALVNDTCVEEGYEEVKGLISYFLLEKRFQIRSELLQTFALLSEKSQAVASVILSSDISVTLAKEISGGDITTQATFSYARQFLQILAMRQLSNHQIESIGMRFHSTLIEMIYEAEKEFYTSMANVLLEVLLQFHKQLSDETEFKWTYLEKLTQHVNYLALKRLKNKLTTFVLNKDTPTESDSEQDAESMMSAVLTLLMDLIISKGTRDLFSDADLDILLVALTQYLENGSAAEFRLEALKTIYRILITIKTEPSALDTLNRVSGELLMTTDAAGGDRSRCYRGVLKKIYKITNFS